VIGGLITFLCGLFWVFVGLVMANDTAAGDTNAAQHASAWIGIGLIWVIGGLMWLEVASFRRRLQKLEQQVKTNTDRTGVGSEAVGSKAPNYDS
jgi:cytochrome c biogenesis protein CcdA